MVLAQRTVVSDLRRVRPLSIIVAENDRAARLRLLAVLASLGARVQEALDGWDLMSRLLAAREPVDLVISDLRLLRASGLDALVSARAAGIGVPFLFLSGSGPDDRAIHHARASRLGAAILRGPVAAAEILACVRCLCNTPVEAASSGRGVT